MIAVFASPRSPWPATETGAAGATTAAGQALLHAVLGDSAAVGDSAAFGDSALRELAERSRVDLHRRVRELFDARAARFTAVLSEAGVVMDEPERLRVAGQALARG